MAKRNPKNKPKKNTPKPQSAKRRPKAQAVSAPLLERDHLFRDHTTNNDLLYKKIFFGIAAVGLCLMLMMSQFTGINEDDKFHNPYEQKLISYYSSGGKDKAALAEDQKGKMNFYGGFFDLSSGIVNRILGSSDPNNAMYHKVRHFWNALIGFLIFLFGGLLAKEIGGWRLGILALLMLFLSPRILGHAVMNPRDIPFAAGYVMAIYFITLFLKQISEPTEGFPIPKWSTLVGLALGIMIAVGARVAGVLVVCYLGLFTLIQYVLLNGFGGIFGNLKKLLPYIAWGGIASIAGFFLALLFWPYGLESPIQHSVKALTQFSNHHANIRILFDGGIAWSRDVPWNYLPQWVAVTVPLFIYIGIAGFLIFFTKIFKRYSLIPLALAAFTFLFPYLYIFYKGSPLYDGWRHLTFTYGSLVVLAATGIYIIYELFQSKKAVTYVLGGVLFLTALDPAIHIARNFSYAYVYFNPLVGGVNGAFGHYETDYWGVSIERGLDWLIENEKIHEKGTKENPVVILTNKPYPTQKYISKYGGKIKQVYSNYYRRDQHKWDYALYVSRFMQANHLQAGTWPNDKTIHTIDVSGAPILAIMKEDKNLLNQAHTASKNGEFDKAIQLLQQETQAYPNNEAGWYKLSEAYVRKNDLANAEQAVDQCLKVAPQLTSCMGTKGRLLLQKNQADQAISIFKTALDNDAGDANSAYYLAMIYNQKNDLNSAMKYIQHTLERAPTFGAAYNLAIEISKKGNNQQAVEQFTRLRKQYTGR